jgi:hypothetical protein
MNKIYRRADDMEVVARLIYGDPNDCYAYFDAAKTIKIDSVNLENVFTRGAIIVDGNNRYHPVGLLADAGFSMITYVIKDDAAASGERLVSLMSEEYVPTTEETAPVTEEYVPATEETAPVTEEPAPAAKKRTGE